MFFSAFSLNCLPINYIEFVEDDLNTDNITLIQKYFIKSGMTYFTNSNTVFSALSNDINIQESGLVNTTNLLPQVVRKRTNLNNKLYPYEIKEIEPITKPYIKSGRKRKIDVDDTETKKKKLQLMEKTLEIKNQYKIEHEKQQENKETIKNLKYYFMQPWKNIDIKGQYTVYAFAINHNDKYPYVGVLAEDGQATCVYTIKGCKKNTFIDLNNKQDLLIKSGCVFLPFKSQNETPATIVYLSNNQPLAYLKTNGTVRFKRNIVPHIEELTFCIYLELDPESI